MLSDEERQQDCDIQQDIRAGRPFSIAEAIGREGSDFLKGDSPVPRLIQARTEVLVYLAHHLLDPSGALHAVLTQWVQADEAHISRNLGIPLMALAAIVESIISSPAMLYEFVRQVDVKWGQMNGERPYFQQPGQVAHPDDEYTHESVYQTLSDFLAHLQASL